MNMDEIQKAFLIEIRDLLDRMEESLFQLQQETTPAELDALFRVLHTIKGNSGIFQARRLEGFAHVLENLLDKYRNEPPLFSASDVPLFLSCRDHIQALAAAELQEGATGTLSDTVEQQDSALREQIAARLQSIGTVAKKTDVAPTASETVSESVSEGPALQHLAGCYHISFRPNANAFLSGLDPLNFIRFLTNLGELLCVYSVLDGMPASSEFDPQKSYLGYEILLRSDEPGSAVEDAFEFIRDDGILLIHTGNSSAADYEASIKRLPESRQRLLQIWSEMPFDDNVWLRSLGASGQSKAATPASSPSSPVAQPAHSPPSKSAQQVALPAAGSASPQASKQSGMIQSTLRVDAGRLDSLINLVGELVIQSQTLRQLSRSSGDASLGASTDTIERLIEDLREQSMSLRMVEIGTVFQKMRRVVHDAAANLNKKVKLKLSGEETELDRSVVERIQDPMIHLVRNSIDHGLGTPEERIAVGKSDTGTIELRAFQDMGHVVVEISDDGKGISAEAVRRRALEKGIITEDTEVDPTQLQEYIFHAGFSTRDTVSEYSGRGVGLDVVKQGIESLGGTVQLSSVEGQGTTISLRLPLTLAIIDGFLVRASGIHFVVPLDTVFECTELSAHKRTGSAGNFINLRGELIPIVHLPGAFQLGQQKANELIVIKQGQRRIGLVVDELLGEYQTVVRSGGRILSNLPGVSGVTILGSGQIAYILDVATFFGARRGLDGGPAPEPALAVAGVAPSPTGPGGI